MEWLSGNMCAIVPNYFIEVSFPGEDDSDYLSYAPVCKTCLVSISAGIYHAHGLYLVEASNSR